jgi:ABC-type antimicrobial peptide transport system ATPase subunit
MVQALQFASDFKLGHYMKSMHIGSFKLIPISDFFISCSQGHVLESGRSSNILWTSLIDVERNKVVATVIAGTVQLGVQAWMFTNIP